MSIGEQTEWPNLHCGKGTHIHVVLHHCSEASVKFLVRLEPFYLLRSEVVYREKSGQAGLDP